MADAVTLERTLRKAETEDVAEAIFNEFDATEILEIIHHIQDRQCSKLP